MYNIKHHQAKFEIGLARDEELYEGILNNPLCTITDNRIIKTKEEEFNDDGVKIRSWEILTRVVTYQIKVLIS